MKGILTGPHAGWIESSALGAKMNDAEMLLVPKTPCDCQHIGAVAEVEVSDVSQAGEFSFGTWPEGFYIVRPCGGAFYYGQGWAVSRAHTGANNPPGSNNFFISVSYQGPEGEEFTNTGEPIYAQGDYATEALAEASACGHYAFFEHCGGEIKMTFVDNPYNDNVLGTPGPTYRLYTSNWTPSIAFTSAVGSLLGGTSFGARFNFSESTSWFGKIILTLEAGGGISSPSAAQTVDVTADTPFYADFTWTASETVVTATITATTNCGASLGSFEVDIGPILTPESTSVTDVGLGCGPPQFRRYGFYFKINNTGNQNTGSPTQVTVTAVSGAVLLNLFDYCTDIPSQVTNIAAIQQGSYQDFNLLARKDGSGDSSAVFDFVIDDGWTTHPAARISVPFP